MLKKMLLATWDTLCDAAQVRTLPNSLPHPRDPNVKTLKLPVRTQSQTHSCGFVVALMVIRYFRPKVNEEDIYQATQSDPDYGTPVHRVVKVLRQYGIRVAEKETLTFEEIQKAIDSNRPILTAVNIDDPDTNHWVVLYGYGIKPKRVYVGPYAAPFVPCGKCHPWGIFRQHHWTDPGFGLICSMRK